MQLLNKDFYHLSAGTIEVKSNTPNGVAFKVTGKSSHEKATTGTVSQDDSPEDGCPGLDAAFANAGPCGRAVQLEGKYTDKPLGKSTNSYEYHRPRRRPLSLDMSLSRILGSRSRSPLEFSVYLTPGHAHLLMYHSRAGLTLTQTWTTANQLESKVELNDTLAKGLKAEGVFSFLPATQAKGAKFNLHFKQSNFHGRAFFDLLKGPTANVDAVIGHEGFLAGASAGYDVQKAAITGYSAAVGYTAPAFTAAVTASDNLSVFAASYYHKVNSQVEAGAKATWNSKAGNNVGLEVASKYRLDPVSFAKAKINDRGIAAVAYNVLLREGVTLGLGASFDTQKLDQATHKVRRCGHHYPAMSALASREPD